MAATSARAAQAPLTPGQYRHQVNAICSEFNQYRLPAIGVANGLGAILVKARAAVADLRRLHPPRSLAELHAEILTANTRRLEVFGSLLAQLKSKKITLSQFAERMAKNPYPAQANELWKRVGATDCVQY
jgi:hypothetical protein